MPLKSGQTHKTREDEPAKPPKVRKRRPLLKWSLISFAVILVSGAGAAAYTWHYLFHDMPALPSRETLWSKDREPGVEVRDRDGDLIEIRGRRYGRFVSLDDLPAHVPAAFLAAEDKRFYEHEGMDTSAILRAFWANLRSGETVQGGSTLTQQLVKNLVLSPEQTFKRKAQEIRLAQRLEKQLSKDEILELYLNRVYLGANSYGVDAAARTYFGKPSTELTLAEASLLATLPKAPSRLALNENLAAARDRQAYVLEQMVEIGAITADEARIARAEAIEIDDFAPDPQMGYLVDMAQARAEILLPNVAPDLVIFLSIDDTVQRAARERFEAAFSEQAEALDVSQASALFLRADGGVEVLLAGRDYEVSQFNRVTQAKRQPGSAFKAFVYASAFELGLDPFTVRQDEPITIGKWEPENYTRGHVGPVTLAEAYAQSLNTVAARLGQEAGEGRIIALGRRAGLLSDLEPLPSIALGSQEVSLWELTRAYGVFATGGYRLDPYLIERIEDSRGNLLYERKPVALPPVIAPDVIADMNAMMLGVVEGGTGGRARVEGWRIAGKTGTSQDSRDAWFMGYTPTLIGGVWTGNDDSSPMDGVTGGELPAELWAVLAGPLLEGETPIELLGSDLDFTFSDEAKRRVGFYRTLSGEFRTVEERG